MYVEENNWITKSGKKYHSILLRESYRENGKVKKRTIANLSKKSPKEIAAIKLALKYKNDLTALGSLKESVKLQEGPSSGAVWTIYKVAKTLGIEKALGTNFAGKLALWQIIARIIDQGSRLSAVRLAQTHAACEILDFKRGFDENDLYCSLGWLSDNQEKIEKSLFKRKGGNKPEIYLYDVTSSYLEGDKNFFAAFGYNRDGKKGKKQIVIGMLCDEEGDPLSTEVFVGNTQDPKTFYPQVQKVAKRFGCKGVTFVGDRGMIKSTQIDNLPKGFHYITAITKPQIQSMRKKKVIQLGLFDEDVCEVVNDNIRYILRRNPCRAAEIQHNRLSKQNSIEIFVKNKNKYLCEHPRARVSTAIKNVTAKIKKLKIQAWLKVEAQDRTLSLNIDEEALREASELDGCYAIKTNLSQDMADKQSVHDRYKDLALVEKAFRVSKTEHLEVRPIFVRSEKSTLGHVFVVMLAYKIIRVLRNAWAEFDLTVEEGIKQLATLCSMEMKVKNEEPCLKIPRPRKESQDLLKALNIRLPLALPKRKVNVATRKKLMNRRKKLKNQNVVTG